MKRRGFSLIELMAALALLVTLISISSPLVVWMVHERRASDQRVWATQEAAGFYALALHAHAIEINRKADVKEAGS